MKIVAIFSVFCVLSEAVEPVGGRWRRLELLSELCQEAVDEDTCGVNAIKCFFKSIPGIKEVFCDCKVKIPGVDIHYSQWVQEGGRDECTIGGTVEAEGQSNVPFYRFLRNHSSTEAELFECCLGKEQNLFDTKGIPIASAWIQNAASSSDVKEEINSAINYCATNVAKTCSPKAFMTCIMQKCISDQPA